MNVAGTSEQLTYLPLIKEVPLLNSLNEDQQIRFLQLGTIKEYPKDTIVFAEKQEVNEMYLILDGAIEFRLKQGSQWRAPTIFEKGAFSGVLPYSRMKTSPGVGKTIRDTIVLNIPREKHFCIEQISYPLMQSLVGLLTDRVREGVRFQQQNEKFVALGKLSAGLAHELNNPASAMMRSSFTLKEHLRAVPEKFKKVISMKLEPEKVDCLNTILFSKLKNLGSIRLTPLQKSEKEDEILEWLEDNNVTDGYSIAESFVDVGFTVADLEYLRQKISTDDIGSALQWLDNVIVTEKLVSEIDLAAGRISTLVNAVKSYSQMDKERVKEAVNFKISIENTLMLLSQKIKEKSAKVSVYFASDVPVVSVFVAEINQVWMHIIDNALDAISSHGEIKISGKLENQFVKVVIEDNGTGIPEENLSRIFEPFFTTKDIGKGTGLGLDVSRRTIEGHNGELKVRSGPGRTEFEVCIPVA